MPITLEEAKATMVDKVDQQIIDMFRRSSLLLDSLTFDNAISPGTGGSTLAYGYTQLKTPAGANVREVNSEYAASEAKREDKVAHAIIMGGSFEVDRVVQNTSGAIDELAFQADQKVKATANYFHNLVINGTSASSGTGYVPKTFDGLKKTLAGTANELTSEVDISDAAKMTSNAHAFLDEIDAMLAAIDGGADMIMMNTKMLTRMRGIARRAGYYDRTKDDFGRVVETYAGVRMVDLGKYWSGSNTVDVIADTAAGSGTFGTTDIFAVKFGLDAFHGIAPLGTGVINSYMPDLTAPGAVKKGEVELVAGAVLKNTLKAAHLKGIAIAPKTA